MLQTYKQILFYSLFIYTIFCCTNCRTYTTLAVNNTAGDIDDTILVPVTLYQIRDGCDTVNNIQGTIGQTNPAIAQIQGAQFQVGFGWNTQYNPQLNTFTMLAPPGGAKWKVNDTLFNLIVQLADQNGECSNLFFSNAELDYRIGCVIDGTVEEVTSRGRLGQICIQDTVIVNGKIHSISDVNTGIANVDVKLLKNGVAQASQLTEEDGVFDFTNVLTGPNYSLFPFKDSDYLNGVSTFDISLIRNYALGLVELSPYQLIAADVNCDDQVNFQDEFLLNNLLIGIDSTFGTCRSWDFVPSDFVFEDSLNPFPFPRFITYETLISDQVNQNFVGIKKGDLDDDAIHAKQYDDELKFAISTEKKEDGYFELAFRSPDFESLKAYQMALQFDSRKIEFDEMNPDKLRGVKDQHLFVKGNSIRMNWISPHGNKITHSPDDILFKLRFRAKEMINDLSQCITLDDNVLDACAYDEHGQAKKILFSFDHPEMRINSNQVLEKEGYKLHQNQPNPFVNETSINFELPKQMYAELRVYNTLGQTVKEIKGNFDQGINQFNLQKGALAFGIYYYELIAEDYKSTRVMKIKKP